MRRHLSGLLLSGAVLIATPAAADVHVAVANGLVSVSATDATIRQILTEWARVGQTRIVNIEKLGGAPLTLELTAVPEVRALDIILRSVSGYVAAPRAVAVPNGSLYDRILLLPTSNPVPGRPAPVQAAAPPMFQAPPPANVPDDQDVDAERVRPGVPPPGGAPGRGAAFNTFPPPAAQVDAQQPPPAPTSYAVPTSPVGVAVPGMPVPAPQTPAQAQPGQPRR